MPLSPKARRRALHLLLARPPEKIVSVENEIVGLGAVPWCRMST